MSSIVVAGDTSGSVTLQAPAVAGSTILTLPAVSGTMVLQTSLGNFQNYTQTSGATTLTSANVGQLIVIGGGTSGITLPLLSAVADGSTLTFISQIGVTISRQGSDTLYTSTGGTVTSVTLAGLDTTLQLTKASGVWYITGGTYLQKAITIPQVTVYTTGSGTYTTPSNTKYLSVKMVGGGGGGAGGGISPTAGGAGGTTSFGTSLLTCTGGGGGTIPANGTTGAGGVATLGGGSGIGIAGGAGTSGNGQSNVIAGYNASSPGGNSAFGGGGGGVENQAGIPGAANTGAGAAGGAAFGGVAPVGGGGGAGGYIDAVITSPLATYAVAIGAGGTAGAAGTSGYAGGAGGSGLIYITAYF